MAKLLLETPNTYQNNTFYASIRNDLQAKQQQLRVIWVLSPRKLQILSNSNSNSTHWTTWKHMHIFTKFKKHKHDWQFLVAFDKCLKPLHFPLKFGTFTIFCSELAGDPGQPDSTLKWCETKKAGCTRSKPPKSGRLGTNPGKLCRAFQAGAGGQDWPRME